MTYKSFDELSRSKGLKIISMNAQSLRSKMKDLTGFIHDIDYLCITESWLGDHVRSAKVNLVGMTLHRQDRPRHLKSRGGVACYVSNRYSDYTTVIDKLTVSTEHLECIGIETKFPGHKYRIIITVYRPPKGNTKECYTQLSNLLKGVEELLENKEIWINGDFNVNTKARNSTKFRNMTSFLRKNHLRYLPTQPTRFHPLGNSTLDHIYTNCAHVMDNGLVKEVLSDHAAVYAIKKQKPCKHEKLKVTGRSYKNYSIEVTKDFVEEYDWVNLFDSKDPGESYDIFINAVTKHLDDKHPVVTRTIDGKHKRGFDGGTLALIRQKRRHMMKARRVKPGVLNLHLAKWKELKRQIAARLLAKQRDGIKTALVKHANDPVNFWKVVNHVWKGEDAPLRLCLTDENGELISPLDTANYVNKYYTNIGPKLAEEFKDLPGTVDIPSLFDMNDFDDSCFSLKECNDYTSKYLSSDIDGKKSSCINDVRSQVIKDIFVDKPYLLSHLINCSISSSTVPNSWKKE